MTFLVFSLALGLLLAQRFKVLALVPTTMLVAVMAIASDVAGVPMPWSKAVMVILGAVGLQVGYLVGLGGRTLVAGGYQRAAQTPGLSQAGTTGWPIEGPPEEPRVYPHRRSS
jgi:hypothetical protein